MNETSSKSKRPAAYFSIYNLVAPVVFAVLFIMLGKTDIVEKLENLTLDQRVKVRHNSQEPIDRRLFLLAIDDPSVTKLGVWPFDREIHGELMRVLSEGKPRVFAWDVIFDSYSQEKGLAPDIPKSSDQSMVSAIGDLEIPVITGVMGFGADSETYYTKAGKVAEKSGWESNYEAINSDIAHFDYVMTPFKELWETSLIGVVNADRHADGVVRKIPFVNRVEDRIIPSLTLAALCSYWNIDPKKDIRITPGEAIYIDSPLVRRRIPIDHDGYYHINYRYELQDLIDEKAVSSYYGTLAVYHQRYNLKKSGIDAPDIQDKIVFIGQIAVGMADIGRSPFSGFSPMVLTHINVIDNVLKEDYLHVPPAWAVWNIFLILAYLSIILPTPLDFWWKTIIPVSIFSAYIGLGVLLFLSSNLALPMVAPSLAFLFLHTAGVGKQVLEERKAREELRQTFSAYVAPGILNSIYDNPNALKLGGAKKEVAILFTDIRSFTSMTEVMDSEILVAQLNEYFTEMVSCINRNGGTLHKFIGDAIMAVWGDVTYTGPTIDAGRSLQSAIEMRNSLASLNKGWIGQDRPEFHMGIGINFGKVTAGNIGAPQRMEFTVIGDPVNLAARLESLNKKFGTEILIGESMYELTHERFLFRPIAKVQVVGKQEGVQIYEALCSVDKPEQSPYDMKWVNLYEEGYSRFMERRFDVAVRLFEACLNDRPNDKTTKLLLETSRDFMETPPPKGWNGTFEMTSK
ncbi:MAG: adenylate/guanylate cyclase domain-containing protein [Verrucomicrobiota bacterium]